MVAAKYRRLVLVNNSEFLTQFPGGITGLARAICCVNFLQSHSQLGEIPMNPALLAAGIPRNHDYPPVRSCGPCQLMLAGAVFFGLLHQPLLFAVL